MVEMRRTIRCSNCGVEKMIHISSELDMNELTLVGRCSSCGNSMQINYSLVEKSSSENSYSNDLSSSDSSTSSTPSVNLDDALFSQDPPSDTLKDIMED